MEGSIIKLRAFAHAHSFGGNAKCHGRTQLRAYRCTRAPTSLSRQLPRDGVRASSTAPSKLAERTVAKLHGVRLAVQQADAVHAAVQAAASAFATDPFIGHYIREEQQAGGLTAEIVQHILTKGNKGSYLLQTLPDRGGIITGFQIPDGKPGDMDLEDLSRRYPHGLEGMMNHYFRFQHHQAEYFKEHGPFTYIAFMAIDPKYQKQGLGSLLLREACMDADEQGERCLAA
ncbi:hypothetical protein DUNSADRAFT_17623 [Dunaliella salina]|uniref:N-acetyltransferase domain-containing protein n=1 Tax=Dunaliella salina TaxID=3046 RepID=A0ABQ7GZV4_DUNSA|nr:hypothetical protein DUNSADRAFT_17623 [Dunaliella salina]|eukprot:KAF5840139.1 hypothetical protein DUNSADRAFT_17623 [Dunaliella salina]